MNVFHYTNLKSGISILQDGFLEVPEIINNNLTPAIWFSKQDKYESSVLKRNRSFVDELKTIGSMRFVYGNMNELIAWEDYKNILELNEEKIKNIENTYVQEGHVPSEWFCSLKNISLKQLESIEVFTDKWDWATEENIQIAVRKAKLLN